jgi:predicted transposase/invertase (TIGR01784 family)
MGSGIDPKVDIIFKRLFGIEAHAEMLIDLLNGALAFPPPRAVNWVEIMNPFNPQETLDDKLSILDIKARDVTGRQFNVEMQVEPYYAYPARVVYYLSKLHQQQLHAGEEYRTLQPSYSINFLNHVLYNGSERWHWQFELRDVVEPAVLFSDQVAVHVIELPKFDLAPSQLTTALERWCYFLRYGETLDKDHLPASLQTPPIRKAMEVLHMLTQSDLERERYESRLKFQRDESARIQFAEERAEKRGEERGEKRGEERGEKRGEERGVKIGDLIGRVQLCESVLKKETTPSEVLKAMKLEQLQELADRLQAQLIKEKAQ